MSLLPDLVRHRGECGGLSATRQKMRNVPLAGDTRELQRLRPEAFYDPRLGDDTPLVLDDDGTIADDRLAEMDQRSPYSDQATWEPSDLSDYRASRGRGAYALSRHERIHRDTRALLGGTAIAQVLNILEVYELRAMG